ncbi:hypothetical protein ACFORJ_03035 [Corynebacterium hansenii]|uniref:Uncharacterized protein n=1 Tax=Corynebacterium hansenii TaxID=394964 RepID=A0ABV7ZLK0_9CORY|nr:hypothetical protein [Corynebacterium hansenii]WJY99025.1 hypothetical protein CHAN_01970 [Corynebacterium hansenii]
MNGNPWWLAIAVDARGGVAGATCIEESDPWRVAGESVGEIVAEALRKHGGMKPVAATLVHPRWMGADTLGEALRDIDRAGVPERLVRATADAEVLMASKTSTVSDMVRDGLDPGARGRLVIVDASSGRVYGVDGAASPVGEGSDVAANDVADAADVAAEVSARLREHGGAGADVALVGLPRDTRAMGEALASVVAEPTRYSLLDLARGALAPESIRTERHRAAPNSRSAMVRGKRPGRTGVLGGLRKLFGRG